VHSSIIWGVYVIVVGGLSGFNGLVVIWGMKFLALLEEAKEWKYFELHSSCFSQFATAFCFHLIY
jgi:hypothetical protein